ncbi:uncharacterized protein PG998_010175 [Apiospora kogelbergensis]|uniref:uncharacterized protein n=1 Tax=Apiospora kogelbergensis TaxID=1337665 RepID=UPI00312D19D5
MPGNNQQEADYGSEARGWNWAAIDAEIHRLTEEDRASRQQQVTEDRKESTSASTTPTPAAALERPEAPPEEELECCNICTEPTKDAKADFVSLPCPGAHRAHPECFKTWIESNNENHDKCPMCRHALIHTCGHLLSVDLLVAGVAIPPAWLERACKTGCPGFQNAERYQQQQAAFNELYRTQVIVPLLSYLSPPGERLEIDILDDEEVLHTAQSGRLRIEEHITMLRAWMFNISVRGTTEIDRGLQKIIELQQFVAEYAEERDRLREATGQGTDESGEHDAFLQHLGDQVEILRTGIRRTRARADREEEQYRTVMGAMRVLHLRFGEWMMIFGTDCGRDQTDAWWWRQRNQLANCRNQLRAIGDGMELIGTLARGVDEVHGTPPSSPVPRQINHTWGGPTFGGQQAMDQAVPSHRPEDWAGAIPGPAASHGNIGDTEDGNDQAAAEPEQQQQEQESGPVQQGPPQPESATEAQGRRPRAGL